MYLKALKPLYLLLMGIWGKLWTICKPHSVGSVLLIKRMYSRYNKPRYPSVFRTILMWTNAIYWYTWSAGLWSATSIARKEYGSQCARREFWWCMFWLETTLWSGLLPHWHHNYPLPCCQELWYGWIFKTGISQGSFSSRHWFSIVLFKLKLSAQPFSYFCWVQEAGFAHMRICDGVGSFLQLSGLLAKFALARETSKAP